MTLPSFLFNCFLQFRYICQVEFCNSISLFVISYSKDDIIKILITFVGSELVFKSKHNVTQFFLFEQYVLLLSICVQAKICVKCFPVVMNGSVFPAINDQKKTNDSACRKTFVTDLQLIALI